MAHYPPPFLYCEILVMLYLTSGSPQHVYQDMQKYGLIVLIKVYWSNPSGKIIPNSISIILWRILYMVSIKEDITPNPPFQFSGPFLVILSVSRNVDFVDTRKVSLIGSYYMCSYNIN